MKMRHSIIIGLLLSIAAPGCKWDNDLYQNYIHDEIDDNQDAQIVPCPGFYYLPEGDSPAYYLLSTGRCYHPDDINNPQKTIPTDAKLITKNGIHTLQGLHDYKICKLFQSMPDYFFNEKGSPAKLNFVGYYEDIDEYYKNFDYTQTNYDYSIIVSSKNHLTLDSKYKDSDKLQICPKDFPICTVYYSPQIAGLEYNFKYVEESYVPDHELEKQIVGNQNEDNQLPIPYKFICTKPNNEFESKEICQDNEVICDGLCINPNTNIYYCGAKGLCNDANSSSSNYQGTTCKPLESCVDGICTKNTSLVYCPLDETSESDLNKETYTYIDPTSNNNHCGAKGACNNSDKDDSDFMGVKCNTPFEQCINGRCTTMLCFDNQMLCLVNGQYECVDINTNERCGGCDISCRHPQSEEIVQSNCKKISPSEDNPNTSYHCEYQCNTGYAPEGFENNDPKDLIIPCVEIKPLPCIQTCADKQVCLNNKCINNTCPEHQCPTSNNECQEQSFLHCGDQCIDCRKDHALNGTCDDGICHITECEIGYQLKTDENNKSYCEIQEGCDSKTLAELGNHVIEAVCEKGKFHIKKCEKGFHIESYKENTQTCVLNTNQSCAPADSEIIMNCTEKSFPTETEKMAFYQQHFFCNMDEEGEECECSSEGNCETTGCKSGYSSIDDDGKKRCVQYNEVFSCGQNHIDCQETTPYNKADVKCISYLDLTSDEVMQNMPTLSWSDHYCHIDNCSSEAHFNGTSSSCRENTIFECGELQETCNRYESCKKMQETDKYQCVWNSRSNHTNCIEGQNCSDGVSKHFICKDDICQNPKIFDTQCESNNNSEPTNCILQRQNNSEDFYTEHSVPTGHCEYLDSLMKTVSKRDGSPDKIVKGRWACTCTSDQVLCTPNCDSNDDLKCHTIEECNQFIQNCVNVSNYPNYINTQDSPHNPDDPDDPDNPDEPVG